MPVLERRLLDRFPGARRWTDDVTVIGPQLSLKGTIRAPGTVVVAGQVDGPVIAGELVRVMEGGLVRGRVQACAALVEGTIEGPLLVSEQIEIRPAGRVKGDVAGARVAIGEGAQIRGRVRSTVTIRRFSERRAR